MSGRRTVRRLNVDGDAQGDLAGHGGEHRAVFVYQIESYRFWEAELARSDFVMGQFGENFTVDGLSDDDVCIGDRYRIGGALFEVTQPRVTCYRVGIRMNEPQMPSLLVKHRRPGFYVRVLQEGDVQAGDAIKKVASGAEAMTVAHVDALLYLPGRERSALERAVRIPALSEGWRGSFEALLRDGDAPRPTSPGFRPVRIASLAPQTSNVVALELEAADGGALAPALPGQYVVVRASLGGASIMRSFSLCGSPAGLRYRLGVKSEPSGTFGPYLLSTARVGDELAVSAPRGSFVLRSGSNPIVLLGAGIGVTPLLAMLRALADERAPREVWWVYAARNGAEHPFADEARELLHSLPNARAHVRYSQPSENDVAGRDFDAAGRLDAALLSQLPVGADAEFYLCGPGKFISDLRAGLMENGVAGERIFSENFGSLPAITPGIAASPNGVPHQPSGAPGTGPAITFARSNLTTAWDARFGNLLELAEACSVPVRWSCRTGVCHTCETGIISGAVGYDPEPLEPPPADNILVCCSKPQSAVILDL